MVWYLGMLLTSGKGSCVIELKKLFMAAGSHFLFKKLSPCSRKKCI